MEHLNHSVAIPACLVEHHIRRVKDASSRERLGSLCTASRSNESRDGRRWWQGRLAAKKANEHESKTCSRMYSLGARMGYPGPANFYHEVPIGGLYRNDYGAGSKFDP